MATSLFQTLSPQVTFRFFGKEPVLLDFFFLDLNNLLEKELGIILIRQKPPDSGDLHRIERDGRNPIFFS